MSSHSGCSALARLEKLNLSFFPVISSLILLFFHPFGGFFLSLSQFPLSLPLSLSLSLSVSMSLAPRGDPGPGCAAGDQDRGFGCVEASLFVKQFVCF